MVSQAQNVSGQPKIIVSSPQQQQSQQAVRMVATQLAGKPIVIASGNKSMGMNLGTSGSVVLGKQTGQQTNQPIILPSQLLNIKTLHGLKVIPTPGGLKTTGTTLYARVLAPSTITTTAQTSASQVHSKQQNPNLQNFPSNNNSNYFGGNNQ